MSRATQELKTAAKEAIRQHVAWLVTQGPSVKALIAFVGEFCQVFVPTPSDEWKQDFHPRPGRGVFAPSITDDEVRIPAGHRVMFHATDHGHPYVAVRADPDAKGRQPIFLMELFDGWEIAMPGGKTAVLRKGPRGGWSIEEQAGAEA